jgi:hypothetical protein
MNRTQAARHFPLAPCFPEQIASVSHFKRLLRRTFFDLSQTGFTIGERIVSEGFAERFVRPNELHRGPDTAARRIFPIHNKSFTGGV